MQDILEKAEKADAAAIGGLTLALALKVLQAALEQEGVDEQHQKQSLAELLASRRAQRLALALTDRVHRSHSDQRTIAAIREATRRIGFDSTLPLLDRLELRALSIFGPAIPGVTANAVKARLLREASPFVLDATPDALAARLAVQRHAGARINLNHLGEAVLGEAEAQHHVDTYLELLERPDIDAISVKLSGVYSQVNVLAFDSVVNVVTGRLKPVLERARKRNRLVYFDMEAFQDLELTETVFARLARDRELLDAQIGIALQAYLPDTMATVNRLLEVARTRSAAGGVPLRFRLVKGANLAAETVEASQHRWSVPIYPQKSLVDANYKRLLQHLLRSVYAASIRVGVGSHNLFDQCYALLLAKQRGLSEMLQLEMLEGMATSVGRVLGKLSGGVFIYAPTVAPQHIPAAISYLVRRLDENTSPENFLSRSVAMKPGDAAFVEQSEAFLRALDLSSEPSVESYRQQDRSKPPMASDHSATPIQFDNAADTDFARRRNRQYFEEQLDWALSANHVVLPRIDGRDLERETAAGFDPSRPGIEAYLVHLANADDIERALSVAESAASPWAKTPANVRMQVVNRVADELEKDRARLVARMVLDAGKRVQEADIEVSEAVDFARYYACAFRESENRFDLEPRGPVVVTPPWNFPLAIPLSGCLAALVTGNPVILKPAPETPLVARAAAEACWRAGIPADALQFVPCRDEVASPLITDPRISTVVLTGATSTARMFLRMRPELHLLAETGGKNAAYVSSLSDRDRAIDSIVHSAFGHAGQKCSALSLLVLEEEVYRDEAFRRALVDATSSLQVGSAWDLGSFVTPLIRPPEGPLARVLSHGQSGARWSLTPERSRSNPQLYSPGILWDVEPGSFVHRTELFGPVLAVLCARDLEQGLGIMNATAYGLTAGFFGLSESEQERFVTGMDAGNLYVNRAITGAVVGRQPFGGRKASSFGPGAKAGGPGYLLQFCHVRPRAGSTASLAKGPLPALSELLPERPGTHVVGEANWLRYQPAPTWLLVGAGASDLDLLRVRRALELAGAHAQQLSLEGDNWIEELGSGHIRRARVLGRAPEGLRKRAAELDITLIVDPVEDDPATEIRHYVMEQTVSVSYHRYGNVSLGETNPLVAAMLAATRR